MTPSVKALVIGVNLVWLASCAALDSIGTSRTPYGGEQNTYPYSSSASRYPNTGFEIEYRKAHKTINNSNRQVIADGITQRMLNQGWYAESIQGNQLIFTNVREVQNQRVFYKTIYNLIQQSGGYDVYASMKLKTIDSPYHGSLEQAAEHVDDRTASILSNVKKDAEQTNASTSVVPSGQQKIFKATPESKQKSPSLMKQVMLTATPIPSPTQIPIDRAVEVISTPAPTDADLIVEPIPTQSSQENPQAPLENTKKLMREDKKEKRKSQHDVEAVQSTGSTTQEIIEE